jgi:porphobilinogen synthase
MFRWRIYDHRFKNLPASGNCWAAEYRPRQPRRPPAPAAADPGAARHGARDTFGARRLHLPAVRSARAGRADAIALDAGVFQWSTDRLGREAESIAGLGIPAVLLFGLPASKDPYRD